MSNDISDKDKEDWLKFISNKEKLPNKDNTIKQKSNPSTRLIDLHGYTLEQAHSKIEKFIKKSYIEKVSKIIVITGKGLHSQNKDNPYVSKDLSILKFSVPEFILNNESLNKMILEIKEAKIEDGGSGAFYIYLRKLK